MKHCIVGGLAVVLMAGGLIAAAPPAAAGCQYGGPFISKCDGPIQPDGTWQRCLAFTRLVPNGASSYLMPERRCDQMGPGQNPGGFGFADSPMRIDD
jgi:hypothetical protein